MTRKNLIQNAAALLAAALTALPPAAPAAAAGEPARLVGPADVKPFFRSVVAIDRAADTVTLPLYRGVAPDGGPAWYIITEASERPVAGRLGVNWSPKIANTRGTAAAQSAAGTPAGPLRFAGTPDFGPDAVLVPNPQTAFPPLVARPGAVGDGAYSPFAALSSGVVLNAPHVANRTGVHDRMVSIDYARRTVTLALVDGFYDGEPILYISTEASTELAATLERSTYVPNLNAAPGLATTDDPASARQPILLVVNGETGVGNPDRQGLVSALLGEGDPLNVLQEEPDGPEYSPLWDAHLIVWTNAAIAAGLRRQIRDTDEVPGLLAAGLITSGGDGRPDAGLGGLRAAGFVINCPVIAEFRGRRNGSGE